MEQSHANKVTSPLYSNCSLLEFVLLVTLKMVVDLRIGEVYACR